MMYILHSIFAALFLLPALVASGGVCHGECGSLVFDEAGNLAAAANDFAVSRFAHDDSHRVVRAETLVGQEVFDTIWRRDAGGLVTNLVSAPGKTVTRAYDADGRLVSVRDWLGHEWSFTHDGAGKPTGGTSPGGTAHAFAYDAADRLVSASVTYAVTNAPVDETYAYDGNGALTNLVSGGRAILTAAYDSQGRLASLNGGAFAYDATGNRIRAGGRIWIPDFADPLKRPLIECDANGTPVRHYLWGDGRLLGFVDADGTLTVAHSDEQGSVVALTAPDGTFLHTACYGPHGEDWGATGENPTPFAWLGGFGVMRVAPVATADYATRALNSTLYLTRHRLYSATLQRFLSSDPLGVNGGLNLYAYGEGDPLAYIDPLGLCAGSSYVGDFFSSFGTTEHWSDAAEFYKGYFWDAPVGAVEGAYKLIAHPVETGTAIGDFVGSVIGDPGGTFGAIGNSFVEAFSTPRGAGNVAGNAAILVSTIAAPYTKAGSQSTTLFRAVQPAELLDIEASGRFRILDAKVSAQGKYFTTSETAAENYGRMAMDGFGDPPYSIYKTSVKRSNLPREVSVDGGLPAYVLPEKTLNKLTPVFIKTLK